ncbi:MAG: DUF1835 domain-containing protein, partial [Bacteroidia bacterium]|nr:DUF1835 domain-containing protein [Bacteroidia bacterium]
YAEISLVCSGNEDETNKLYGLNELTDEQLLELYNNRLQLSQNDIEYADYVWQLYCSDNPIRLENLMDFDNYQYAYLSDAIKAHLKRFPTIKNGLNELENKILQISASEQLASKKELLGAALNNQGYYGFGDSQFQRVITHLKPLFTGFNPVKLTKKGKEILDGQTSYYAELRDESAYLGGALKYNYLYNTESDRILKL